MADQIELENSQTIVDGNGVINLPTGKNFTACITSGVEHVAIRNRLC